MTELRNTWIARTPLARFLDLDAPDAGALGDAPIGVAPASAMEQLLTQIDRRYPFRGKGTLDGLDGDVLRITDDPGTNGRFRTGPDLATLQRAVGADPRTKSTAVITGPRQTRYLAIWPHAAQRGDTSMWDLSALDAGGMHGEVEAPSDAPDAEHVNAFGCDLYQKARTAGGNLVLSPSSIVAALAMTLGGARGRTASQMRRVLHVEGPTEAAVEAAGRLLGGYASGMPGVTLHLANRLFGDKAYSFDPAFLTHTAEFFGAPLEPVDFKNDRARRRINRWVADQTEGRIEDLIPVGGVDALTRLVLANAIYFFGDWEQPFLPDATRPEPFFAGPTELRVPMMHQTEELRFARVDGLRVLELPYRGGDLAMVVALPDAADGLDACEASLSAATIAGWRAALSPTRVAVSLPRFQLEPPSLSLREALTALGMPLAFDRDKADFTGIASPPDPDERLAISDVFHKAFIKVDEKGTEAAAATGAVMAARSLSVERRPVSFRADHPFMFLLVDRRSGLVLFMGRVCEPAACESGTTVGGGGGPEVGAPNDERSGEPLRLLRETGDAQTGRPAETTALGTLLAQIDDGWPLRFRGSHDGLLSEMRGGYFKEPRRALRISEDNRMNGPYAMGPNILTLLYLLRTDPRVESTEIEQPSLWGNVDIPYLKVVLRPGGLANDPHPWDLSVLDTQITPETGRVQRGVVRDTGAAVEDVPAAIYMRSIVDVVDAGDALFSWRHITVTYKRRPRDQGLVATFWVFVDALRERQSGLRWPCSAAEAQLVADRILVAPQDLPQWWGPPSTRSPCLMMTARLMAARWLNARDSHEIIPPHPQNVEDLLIAGVRRMNAAIDRDLALLTPRDPWVADPGKIWALDRRLFDGTARAVNYGEHVDVVESKGNRYMRSDAGGALVPLPCAISANGAIPGLSLIQSIGDTHGADHIDYSQILLLVAPWCMVAREGVDQMVPMLTRDVYQSADLAGLVTDDAKPLAGLRQPFSPSDLEPARAGFWAQQKGVWRQKQRLGLGVLDPLPPGALAFGRGA